MATFNFSKERILKSISAKKNFLVSIVSIVLFFFIGITYLSDIDPEIESVPNYDELIKNPYENYEKITERRNIKRLINNKQFIEMEYDENIVKIKEPEKRDDLFLRSFEIRNSSAFLNLF